MPATLAEIQTLYGDKVYPLYKDQSHEPYMEHPKSKRKDKPSYLGVVLVDELEDKIKCEECGKWFKNLTTHLQQRKNHSKHGLTPVEYREKYSLLPSIPLVSPGVSAKLSKSAIESNSGRVWRKGVKALEIWRENNLDRLKKNAAAMSSYKSRYQHKNKKGLCEAQMAARYLVVMHQVGWNPGVKTIRKHDSSLWAAIRSKYGSMTKFRNSLKLPTEMDYANQLSNNGGTSDNRYDDTKMIAELRNFVIQHKRLPTRSEYKRAGNGFPHISTYRTHFGSWRRAKMMAGVEQLLEEMAGVPPSIS